MKQINSKTHKSGILAALWIVPILVSGMVYVGCGGSGDDSSSDTAPTPSPTATASPVASPTPLPIASPIIATITVVGMSFGSPITVKSGTTVTWQNASGLPHNVIWDSRSPNSSPAPGDNIATFGGGASANWVAPTVTTNTEYDYHCGIHGPMMSGKITVTP